MSLAARSISPVSQAAVLALRRNVRSNSSLQAVPSLARLDLRISGMETAMPSDGMNAVRKRRPESDSRTPCGAISAESKARRRRVEMGQRVRAFGRLRAEAFWNTWAKASASLGNLTGYAAPPLGIYASSEISLSILGHVHSCIRSSLRAFRGGLQVFLRRPRSRK